MASIVYRSKSRFLFIDALRGLAALAVVGFHFYSGSPLKEHLSQIFPHAITSFLENGHLAVEIFFVISGFVIAHSIGKAIVTLRTSIRFIFFRFIRLHPPYITTIFLTILVNHISNFLFLDRKISTPEFQAFVAHFFYLQDILNFEQISPVLWTLCIEFQFYIFFLVLLNLGRFIKETTHCNNEHPGLFVICFIFAVVSLKIELGAIEKPFSGYFIAYWYAFFTGILVQWVLSKKIFLFYLLSFYFILILVSIANQSLEIFVVLVSGLSIYTTVNFKKIDMAFDHFVFQYLGSISYSLYLTHVLVGTRMINISYRFFDTTPMIALVSFVSAFLVSIFSAHLFYRYVEKPCIELIKYLKIKQFI
jgi:peptidoglycan/LPS O-acetylase OafA/YrhL